MTIIATKATIIITFSFSLFFFFLHEHFKVLEAWGKKSPGLQVSSNNFGQNFFNKASHYLI